MAMPGCMFFCLIWHGHAHGCVLKIARRHGCAHGHAWDHAGTDNLAGMAMRSAGIFQKKKNKKNKKK